MTEQLSADPTMRKFEYGAIGAEQGEQVLFSDFEDDGEMWTGQGPRVTRQRVAFSEPFLAPPMVHVSLTMWDIASNANNRADISADTVDQDGFDLVFRTWGDTRVARVRAAWLAVGPVRSEEQWEV